MNAKETERLVNKVISDSIRPDPEGFICPGCKRISLKGGKCFACGGTRISISEWNSALEAPGKVRKTLCLKRPHSSS
jgi:hypothetical protein